VRASRSERNSRDPRASPLVAAGNEHECALPGAEGERRAFGRRDDGALRGDQFFEVLTVDSAVSVEDSDQKDWNKHRNENDDSERQGHAYEQHSNPV
jgi:hypothetical protein